MVMRHVLFILRDDNELEMPENMVLRKLFRNNGHKQRRWRSYITKNLIYLLEYCQQ